MDKRAIVAMSGGVDSSVAALLVQQAGYEAMGVTLRLHGEGQGPDPAEDARAAAARLGLDFTVLDFSGSFREQVVERFAAAYQRGETPNPCIDCNRYVKFGRLMAWAREHGFAKVASGHYARVEQDEKTGRWLLKKGLDPRKDQSYVLYALTQEELSMLLLPLGGLTKAQVRQLAQDRGFATPGSRRARTSALSPTGTTPGSSSGTRGGASPPGRLWARPGRSMGSTGESSTTPWASARGWGCPSPSPCTSSELDGATRWYWGSTESSFPGVGGGGVQPHRGGKIEKPLRVKAKVRYRQEEQPATVEQVGPETLRVVFDEPQRAITKGQAVVLYQGDTVVGGGTIGEMGE